MRMAEQLELPINNDVVQLATEIRALTKALQELIRMIKMEQGYHGKNQR